MLSSWPVWMVMTKKPINCWQKSESEIIVQARAGTYCKTSSSVGILAGRSTGEGREWVISRGDQFVPKQSSETPDKLKNLYEFFSCLHTLGGKMRCRYSQSCFLPPTQKLFWGTNDTCLPPLHPSFGPPIQTKPSSYS